MTKDLKTPTFTIEHTNDSKLKYIKFSNSEKTAWLLELPNHAYSSGIVNADGSLGDPVHYGSCEWSIESAWFKAMSAPPVLPENTVTRIMERYGIVAPSVEDAMTTASSGGRTTYACVLRAILKARLGFSVSVKGNSGTAYSWIHVGAFDKIGSAQRVVVSRALRDDRYSRNHDVHPTYGNYESNYLCTLYAAAGLAPSTVISKN